MRGSAQQRFWGQGDSTVDLFTADKQWFLVRKEKLPAGEREESVFSGLDPLLLV